jgi:hypothetical protein
MCPLQSWNRVAVLYNDRQTFHLEATGDTDPLRTIIVGLATLSASLLQRCKCDLKRLRI